MQYPPPHLLPLPLALPLLPAQVQWLPLLCGMEKNAGEISVTVKVRALDKLVGLMPLPAPWLTYVAAAAPGARDDVLAPVLPGSVAEMVLHTVPMTLAMLHVGTGHGDAVGTLVLTTHRLAFIENADEATGGDGDGPVVVAGSGGDDAAICSVRCWAVCRESHCRAVVAVAMW